MIEYETSKQWEYVYSKLSLTTVPIEKVKNNVNQNDILPENYALQMEEHTISNDCHPKKLWYSKEFLVQFGISIVGRYVHGIVKISIK